MRQTPSLAPSMVKRIYFVFLILICVSASVYSLETKDIKESSSKAREMMLGGLLKGALENMHITKMKIDDEVSKKALEEFIKKIDFGKQFLTKVDVADFHRYDRLLDDELESGKLEFMDFAFDRLKERQGIIKTYVFERLKKPFDFKKEVPFETDSEKRKFVGNITELYDLWENILKYEILSEYADLKEKQDFPEIAAAKDKKNQSKKAAAKKDKNVKAEPKLTDEKLMAKSLEEVEKSYKKIFDRIEDRKRDFELDKFYNSFARIYDPHTDYLIPEDKDVFDIDMSGKLEGIGALLREDGIYIKVEDVIPGSPSWKTKKVEKDDLILKVSQGSKEAVDVVNMSVQDAVKLIRGKKGTEVRLTLKKPDGLIIVVPIVRDVVELEESYVKTVTLQKKGEKSLYGYISLPKFYRDFNDKNGRNCSDDMKKALEQLNKKKVDGAIVDLRNNGGGALIDAALMSGLFIKKGPIVQVKAQTGAVEVLDDKDMNVTFDKPLIVLVNNNSASASEIVAAALQDYGRAIVVGGEHTHGKGTVQQVIDLDNVIPPMAKPFSPFGAIKVTIQKFYRITGGSTQYKGVTPDVILPDPMSVLEKGERFLEYSLPWAQVAPVEFSPWEGPVYNRMDLVSKSTERVKKSEKFKKIFESIDWYKTRKEQTQKILTLEKFMADRTLVRTKSKEIEEQVQDKDLATNPITEITKEEDKERFQNTQDQLQKDPYIDESLNILSDMVSQTKTTANMSIKK